MILLFRLKNKLRKKITGLFYKELNSERTLNMRRNIKNNNFSMISCNCIGGFVYHDLGMQFLSPTINGFIPAHDFIKLAGNLEHYMSVDPIDAHDSSVKYPVIKIDDIEMHCNHYKTAEEAIDKWQSRKSRINYDNLFFVFSDRDGFDKSMLEQIDKLPYKKVFFSHTNYGYDWCVDIPECKNFSQVEGLTDDCDLSGKKYYEKYFDIIKWLNGADIKDCKLL